MAINLEKGQRINLKKSDGRKLQHICVGVNWGAIDRSVFGLFKYKEAVDLDASCAEFDAANNVVDQIWFRHLHSNDGAINHSGDDLTGDMNGNDELDNEVITVDLTRIPAHVDKIAFVLNSFRGHDFKTIPFASIRIYEGTPQKVNEVFATFDIANDKTFAGNVSMVMGVFYRRNGEWKFRAIGEPTSDRTFEQTVATVRREYL